MSKDSAQAGQEHSKTRYDYLGSKYIFRFPFTFTALKWGFAMGSFFALHTYIKSRNLKKAAYNYIGASFFSTWGIWAYFYIKYNYYQKQIFLYQNQQSEQMMQYQLWKKYIELKLGLPNNHNLNEQDLMNNYQALINQITRKNSQLDCLLAGITSTTFDNVEYKSIKSV